MPRKGQTIRTDLFSATRQGCSTNGNPRFDLHTSDGTYRTQSDAGCSYDVDNIVRTIPRGETIPVILHATPAGRVWDVVPILLGGFHEDAGDGNVNVLRGVEVIREGVTREHAERFYPLT